MTRTWLCCIFSLSLLAGAPARKPTVPRADATAVVSFEAGSQVNILRFEGHTFPWLLRNGLPVLQDPTELAGGCHDRIPCRTRKGASWISWAALERHLADGAWPAKAGTPFMGLLSKDSGRWELLTDDSTDGLLQRRGIPLANVPAPTMAPGNILIIGRLETLDSADQRNEAYLVAEKWVNF